MCSVTALSIPVAAVVAVCTGTTAVKRLTGLTACNILCCGARDLQRSLQHSFSTAGAVCHCMVHDCAFCCCRGDREACEGPDGADRRAETLTFQQSAIQQCATGWDCAMLCVRFCQPRGGGAESVCMSERCDLWSVVICTCTIAGCCVSMLTLGCRLEVDCFSRAQHVVLSSQLPKTDDLAVLLLEE